MQDKKSYFLIKTLSLNQKQEADIKKNNKKFIMENTAMKKLSTIFSIALACLLLSACSNTATTSTATPSSKGGSISFTTANIQNAHMTTGLSDAGAPKDTVTSYKTTAEELIVSAELRNAPDNTLVTFVLRYVTSDINIGNYQVNSGDITDRYIYCEFMQNKAWPVGEYAVDFYIDDQQTPTKTVTFTVTE